jgi:hypothetical protein
VIFVGWIFSSLFFNVSISFIYANKIHGRPRHRWEDNIMMDLQEVGWGACTGLIWLRIETSDRHLSTE